MSQDERMRKYKEQYGAGAAKDGRRDQKPPRPKGPEAGRPRAGGGAGSAKPKPARPESAKAEAAKTGLIGRIKRLFGGGKG